MELVNAGNGSFYATLSSPFTLSLSSLTVASISIKATGSGSEKSVRFVTSTAAGTSVTQTENNAPWALLGDNGNSASPVYTAWKPVAGTTYTIKATGYSATGATGTAGNPLSITINVIP